MLKTDISLFFSNKSSVWFEHTHNNLCVCDTRQRKMLYHTKFIPREQWLRQNVEQVNGTISSVFRHRYPISVHRTSVGSMALRVRGKKSSRLTDLKPWIVLLNQRIFNHQRCSPLPLPPSIWRERQCGANGSHAYSVFAVLLKAVGKDTPPILCGPWFSCPPWSVCWHVSFGSIVFFFSLSWFHQRMLDSFKLCFLLMP